MQTPYCPFPALSSPLCSLCTTWHYSFRWGPDPQRQPWHCPVSDVVHVNVECFPPGCPWLWLSWDTVYGTLQNFSLVMNCGNPHTRKQALWRFLWAAQQTMWCNVHQCDLHLANSPHVMSIPCTFHLYCLSHVHSTVGEDVIFQHVWRVSLL